MAQPLSILYDARTVRPGMSGVGRYACNLLAELARLPDPPKLRALFLAESLPFARRDPAYAGIDLIEAPYGHEAHPRAELWLERDLPRMVRPGEIFHGPAFLSPGGARPFARAVTIHDLFVFTLPGAFPVKFRLWLRWMIRRAARSADCVIVPTQAVADEMARLRIGSPEKTAVIPYAPDNSSAVWNEGFAPAEADPDDAPLHRLVSVGTCDPRKDPQTARLALMLYCKNHPTEDLDWLWIGGKGDKEDPTPATIVERSAALGFRTVGARPAAEVRRALAGAAAYVTCSRAEGFGIPIAEALAAGCPVIASDLPVHREVAGDAALYFRPGDPAALAERIAKLLADPTLAAALRRRAIDCGGRFSWGAAAAATRDRYEAIRSG